MRKAPAYHPSPLHNSPLLQAQIVYWRKQDQEHIGRLHKTYQSLKTRWLDRLERETRSTKATAITLRCGCACATKLIATPPSFLTTPFIFFSSPCSSCLFARRRKFFETIFPNELRDVPFEGWSWAVWGRYWHFFSNPSHPRVSYS